MKVAIVEDEVRLAKVLKEGFEYENHQVDLFHTAASAQERLDYSGSLYDLVILDLMLPDGDGADICFGLRSSGVKSPILVLTARDSTEDKVDLLDRGADDFLTKPFDFDELLARSRALVRRAADEPATSIKIGDFELDSERFGVKRNGVPIALTAREFELLSYLVRNRGRVVSREELRAKVWGAATSATTNVVDVHIRNLRKKIDDSYEEKVVQTVHGLGYTIAA